MYGGDHPTKDDEKWQEQPEDRPAERTLARRELLVAGRRATHVGALRRRRRPGGARGAGPARAQRHSFLLFLARLRPEPETARRARSPTRFGDFLDAHVELGLGTIPTFIVGHMSGQNWDPPWRGGRDLYRDPWLLSQQAWFAGEIARRFGSHRAVVGWLDLQRDAAVRRPGHERRDRRLGACPRPGGSRGRSDAADLARRRRLGRRGDRRATTATRCERSRRSSTSSGRTPTRCRTTRCASSSTPAFACELAGSFGKPVVLEEFGVSSDFAADEHAAAYYRQVLHTTLLAGARGWIAWNNCDFDDLRAEDPYRHHLFELHFGLTDRTASQSRSCSSSREFAALVRDLSAQGWERVAGDVAIVVPEHFERVLARSPSSRTASDLRDNLFQAYVAAREADLPVAPMREYDGLRGAARLYLAPCAKLLTAPGVDRLRGLAEGARPSTPRTSPAAPRTSAARGSRGWTRSSGFATACATASSTRSRRTRSMLQFVEDFGGLPAGTRLSFQVGGESSARAYLPVEPALRSGRRDRRSRTAGDCLRNELGRGRTVFCTYPLEHFAARTPRVNPEETWRLYSALAEVAGVSRPVRVDDPRVLVGRLRGGRSETAILVNVSGDDIAAEPLLEDGIARPTEIEEAAAAEAYCSLRGIGHQATLVLLNGRRIANYAFTTIGADLNAIPMSAVERVEVLKDGASAIYGSDAMAGVINFILRKNYQGVEAQAQYTSPEHTGGYAKRVPASQQATAILRRRGSMHL